MQQPRQRQLVETLRASERPLSGQELSEVLGVSARSVRKYVQALNAESDQLIRTSHRGYSVNDKLWRQLNADEPTRRIAETPMERLYYIARRLVEHKDGEDLYDLAEMLHVSDSTIEGDLSKVRVLLAEYSLELHRTRSRVKILGSERDQRKLVRQLLLESARGVSAASLTTALSKFQGVDVRELTGWLREALDANGLTTQEYGLHDLALHVGIAVARIADGHTREHIDDVPRNPQVDAAASQLAERIEAAQPVIFSDVELAELARLILTRTGSVAAGVEAVGDEYLTLVQSILRDLAERFMLDIDDDTFVINLSLHVRNLVSRARTGTTARNPLRRAFKQDHPLIHELAVFVADAIERETRVTIDEDEIVFIAFHLGGYLQRTLESASQVRIVCVAPHYYTTSEEFTRRVQSRLGDAATVVSTITTLDHEWWSLDADLVVTSTPLPPAVPVKVLEVSPIPSSTDLDAVVDAVRSARAVKSGERIRWALTDLIDPRLFTRRTCATRDEAIALMAAQLQSEGIVGPGFAAEVLDRERLSPTAFGGSIAVPHSMTMTANRTAISILVSEEPIDWAGSSVHLVALFALSPTGRQTFRDVLDDFIATLADPPRIARIVKVSSTYDLFADALLAEISR